METVRTVEGEIEAIADRIASNGDSVVEMILNTPGGREKCIAYADKATQLQSLMKKMHDLAQRNGVGHIKELHVKVEITGILKNQAASKDIMVTGIKIVT